MTGGPAGRFANVAGVDLRLALRRDWLMLNSGAVRNALVAAAADARRAAERTDAERALRASAQTELRRAL